MISPKDFVDALIEKGVTTFSGTPCSYMNTLLNEVLQRESAQYIPASSEGEAVSMMAGAWVGGSPGVVMCQNSGLGNMVNPLTSLNIPFGIPVLLLISRRGKPGQPDEPQHRLMGKMTTDLLDLMEIPWTTLPQNSEDISPLLDAALDSMKTTASPFAIVIDKGTIGPGQASYHIARDTSKLCSREEAIRATVEAVPKETVIVATTGKTGRELFTVADRPSNIYCVGSMGYANSLAHGIALHSANNVIVLDGDGAALMHLGNLATIAAHKAKNLTHVILDNGTYDSTGGQPTVSPSVDFVKIAQGAGYKRVVHCLDLDTYTKALLTPDGPSLIYMKIAPGSMANLARPSITPSQVARRLRDFIQHSQGELYAMR